MLCLCILFNQSIYIIFIFYCVSEAGALRWLSMGTTIGDKETGGPRHKAMFLESSKVKEPLFVCLFV